MPKWFVLVALLSLGCHPPATIQTQPGRVAYSADQIVVRVNELERTAIAAEANGGLPTNQARILVQFAVAADKTLAATPAGWQMTVTAAWAQTKQQLPAVTNPAVVAAMGAVDVVLATVTP